MLFAQFTYRESLQHIEACLRVQPENLYQVGCVRAFSRNTLAHRNSMRDWRIYAEFVQRLINIAR